jgi:hypothetical protein
LAADGVGGSGASRKLVIDLRLLDEQDGRGAGQGDRGDQIKNPFSTEVVPRQSGQCRRGDISTMVEGLVAAHPSRKPPGADEAEGDGRDGGLKYRHRDAVERLGRHDEGQGRHGRDGGTTHSDEQRRDHNQQALLFQRVDEPPARRLRKDRRNAHGRHGDADTRRIPMLRGEQVNGQIGPDAVAHIGEQYIK